MFLRPLPGGPRSSICQDLYHSFCFVTFLQRKPSKHKHGGGNKNQSPDDIDDDDNDCDDLLARAFNAYPFGTSVQHLPKLARSCCSIIIKVLQHNNKGAAA